MLETERHRIILSAVQERPVVTVADLCALTGASEATVRRDFEKLESQGKLRRVQGGAVPSGTSGTGFDAELSIRAKNNLNTQEKQLVARVAAENVEPGECVYLDTGTSIAPLAQFLLAKPIRIVTCNNLVLQRVKPESRAEVFIPGGRFLPADQMIMGAIAESTLENFAFHRAFISCMGLSVEANTAYVTEMESMKIKQIAIKNAEKSYLLADSSKLQMVGLLRAAGLDAFEKVYLNGPRPRGEYPANMVFVE